MFVINSNSANSSSSKESHNGRIMHRPPLIVKFRVFLSKGSIISEMLFIISNSKHFGSEKMIQVLREICCLLWSHFSLKSIGKKKVLSYCVACTLHKLLHCRIGISIICSAGNNKVS